MTDKPVAVEVAAYRIGLARDLAENSGVDLSTALAAIGQALAYERDELALEHLRFISETLASLDETTRLLLEHAAPVESMH